jgi:hypothetical protein
LDSECESESWGGYQSEPNFSNWDATQKKLDEFGGRNETYVFPKYKTHEEDETHEQGGGYYDENSNASE